MAKTGYSFTVTLVPGLDAKVKQLGSVQAALLSVAQEVAQAAIAIAPVGTEAENDIHIGAYRDSISAAQAGEGAVVIAAAPHSHFVEFGVPGRGIPAQAVFQKAAESLGLK